MGVPNDGKWGKIINYIIKSADRTLWFKQTLAMLLKLIATY